MTRTPLAGADLYVWIALRRVNDGGVAKAGEWWLYRGRQVPGYVAKTLAVLCERELVALADLDSYGMKRAALTAAGAARHERLCHQRQAARGVPVPQFSTNCAQRSVGDHNSAGLRQSTLTDARLAQSHDTPAGLLVPDPHFPTKIPAGCRSSPSAPYCWRLLAASRIPALMPSGQASSS